MDHRQLLNFLSVCEEKSFSKAAKRCFITHQGLSKSIKLLEDEFNVPLFIRTSSGIETTEYGKALQNAVLPYISQHDKIIDMMRHLKDRNEQHLSIGMINGYHKYVLPPCFFSLFMDTNPDISIDIMSFTDDIYQQSMVDYKTNIGFANAPVNENLFESLFSERIKIGLVVGKTHCFSKRESIKPHELKDEQFIVLDNNRRILDFCYRHDIKPCVRLSLTELDLAYELCASGRMTCLAGYPIANLFGLKFIAIEDSDLYIEIHLVANRNTHKSEAAEKFIAYAREQLLKWSVAEAPPG
jgi:DNA-binding transcriptional LysR family regulator